MINDDDVKKLDNTTKAIIIGGAALILTSIILKLACVFENYADFITTIGVVVSAGLAILAYILTIKLQKTDKTIEVLIEQNEIVKNNINEQKKIYLNRYNRNLEEIQNEIDKMKCSIINETDIKTSIMLESLSNINISINKLWLLPVVNLTREFEELFDLFKFDVFARHYVLCNDTNDTDITLIDDVGYFFEIFELFKKSWDANAEAYKKTFL